MTDNEQGGGSAMSRGPTTTPSGSSATGAKTREDTVMSCGTNGSAAILRGPTTTPSGSSYMQTGQSNISSRQSWTSAMPIPVSKPKQNYVYNSSRSTVNHAPSPIYEVFFRLTDHGLGLCQLVMLFMTDISNLCTITYNYC